MIFVVRATLDPEGALKGVVTDARSGAKQPFAGEAALGIAIRKWIDGPPDPGHVDMGMGRLEGGKSR